MPRSKYKLPKRYDELIDIAVNTPSVKSIQSRKFILVREDYLHNTVNSLMNAIEVLTVNTMYEKVGKDIIDNASEVLKYLEDLEDSNC